MANKKSYIANTNLTGADGNLVMKGAEVNESDFESEMWTRLIQLEAVTVAKSNTVNELSEASATKAQQ